LNPWGVGQKESLCIINKSGEVDHDMENFPRHRVRKFVRTGSKLSRWAFKANEPCKGGGEQPQVGLSGMGVSGEKELGDSWNLVAT
jgi:hypothetical protein